MPMTRSPHLLGVGVCASNWQSSRLRDWDTGTRQEESCFLPQLPIPAELLQVGVEMACGANEAVVAPPRRAPPLRCSSAALSSTVGAQPTSETEGSHVRAILLKACHRRIDGPLEGSSEWAVISDQGSFDLSILLEAGSKRTSVSCIRVKDRKDARSHGLQHPHLYWCALPLCSSAQSPGLLNALR